MRVKSKPRKAEVEAIRRRLGFGRKQPAAEKPKLGFCHIKPYAGVSYSVLQRKAAAQRQQLGEPKQKQLREELAANLLAIPTLGKPYLKTTRARI
jgi:hypothetical protein